MTYQIPVVDLDAALGDNAPPALLDQVRWAVERTSTTRTVDCGRGGWIVRDPRLWSLGWERPSLPSPILATWPDYRPYVTLWDGIMGWLAAQK